MTNTPKIPAFICASSLLSAAQPSGTAERLRETRDISASLLLSAQHSGEADLAPQRSALAYFDDLDPLYFH